MASKLPVARAITPEWPALPRAAGGHLCAVPPSDLRDGLQDSAPQIASPSQQGAIRALPWREMESRHAIAAWDALATRASEPNPFHESWYLLPAMRVFDPEGEVMLLRFQMDGELAGIMPLHRQRRYYRWPIPQMGNWLHPNCFLGAPLVTRGLEEHFWRALLRWADRHTRMALFLHLSEMPLSGPLYEALSAVLVEEGRDAALVHRESRVMLATDLAREEYYHEAVSLRKRKNLDRLTRRLAEHGTLAVDRRDDETGIELWIESFLALEASGWKGKAGSALACAPQTRRMFHKALAGAARRGRLERLSLLLDGRPIAMLATFLAAPGAFSYKTAFDEKYAHFSPGVLLQRENLAMIDRADIRWTDSCAGADHPMISHLWRERRDVGRISIAIGGPLRRRLFRKIAQAELGRTPTGLDA